MNIIYITQKIDDKNEIQNFILSIYSFLRSYFNVKVMINDKETIFNNEDYIFLGSRSKNFNFFAKIIKTFYLYQQLIRINRINKIDIIYVHQLGIFVALLFPLKLFLNFRIYFWRAHTYHSKFTFIYYLLSDKIFSTNKKTIYDYKFFNKKIFFIGQMVEVNLFENLKKTIKSKKFLYIGRVTEIKNIHIMIDFIEYYNNHNNHKIYLDIFGPRSYIKQDTNYFNFIVKKINKKNLNEYINFKGVIKRKDFPIILKDYFGYLNFSDGAIDKSVLEAALCGLLIFSSNDAFNYEFNIFNGLVFNTFDELSKNINNFYNMDSNEIKFFLKKISAYIAVNHSLQTNYLRTFFLN